MTVRNPISLSKITMVIAGTKLATLDSGSLSFNAKLENETKLKADKFISLIQSFSHYLMNISFC